MNLSHDLSVFRTCLVNYSDYHADIPERLREILWKSKVWYSHSQWSVYLNAQIFCSTYGAIGWTNAVESCYIMVTVSSLYNYRQECAWKFQYSIMKTQSTSLCNYFICHINKCLVLILLNDACWIKTGIKWNALFKLVFFRNKC